MQKRGAILGLDIGDKRIGVAIAQGPGHQILGLPTLERAQGKAEQELLRLIAEHSVELVVAGLPMSSGDQKTEQCLKVESFCRRLERRAAINIVFVDEYLSSVEAIENLGLKTHEEKRARRQGLIDAEAARSILKAYLEANAGK